MIVAVEGPSAAGKTTWIIAHRHGAAVIAEAQPGPAPHHGSDPASAAIHRAKVSATPWAVVCRVEEQAEIAVCDTDRSNCTTWCLGQTGHASARQWRAEVNANASYWPAGGSASSTSFRSASRAGASDIILGNALTLTAVIRTRIGDLPGALATLQHHADGARLLLGYTLRPAAMMLARLGEAGPAAVLFGALAAHFPGSLSHRNESDQRVTGRAHALAQHALGEAAYDAMDEDEVVRYAVGELRRVAALLAQPGVPARTHRPVRRPGRRQRPRVRRARHYAGHR
jgi:hypothetical protein